MFINSSRAYLSEHEGSFYIHLVEFLGILTNTVLGKEKRLEVITLNNKGIF